MENKQRTDISTIGEFGLIHRLTENISPRNASTIKGIGDDAAVLDYDNKRVLVTTDLLLEGIHFDLTYVPLKHLGYKSAVVNFSDIYAMNGRPRQITVSLGISKRFSIEDLEELYEIFNNRHPPGYAGHSLSVSDLLELYDESGRTFFFVDSFVIRKVDMKPENPTMAVNQSM